MADQTITCKECSTGFTLTEGEAQWFVSNDMQPPKRCKECRVRKRNQSARVTTQPEAQVYDPTPTRDERPSRRKGGRRDDRDERY